MVDCAISMKAALEQVEEVEFTIRTPYAVGYNDALALAHKKILALPALGVEDVVFCKDCRYRGDNFSCPLVIRIRDAQGLSRTIDNAHDDDFCSRGRRKNETEAL